MEKKKHIRTFYNLVGIVVFIILTLIDQLTKRIAVVHLKDQDPVILIKNIFQLQYLENRGAAFGILQGQKGIFIVITVIILAAVIYIYAKMPVNKRFLILRILILLIAAGAVGNFIDRIRQGYVVDFFYFSAINFPIFNVADIYVTCAAVLLILTVLFYYKDQDLKDLGHSLKFGVNDAGRN